VRRIAAATGLPDAQRDPGGLAIVKVPQIGTEPRTAERTVRKLSRVEMLRRSGVLDPHEADACEYYADTAALAWDTVRCTANYALGGGGGGASAPDHLAAKTIEIADARDDYRFAERFIPQQYIRLFEAVICRNETIGTVAGVVYGELGRSQREEKVRRIVKLCANLLHTGVGHRLTIR
jgi:hypothetical protein